MGAGMFLDGRDGTPKLNGVKSNVSYDQLQQEALKFLAHCGEFTMLEQSQHGMKHAAVSANECLGMATRITAEMALQIQSLADQEEQQS